MTDRETLYSGLSNAAWGYFLIHFNFNLGLGGSSINILPEFAGFLLLAWWHGAKWALAIVGVDMGDIQFVYLSLIVMTATLYFHYQFLTDMAFLAEKYQPPGEGLDRRIRGRRTALLVLSTGFDLLGSLVQLFRWEEQASALAGAGTCVAAVVLILVVLIMVSLFQLRRFVREWNLETPASLE